MDKLLLVGRREEWRGARVRPAESLPGPTRGARVRPAQSLPNVSACLQDKFMSARFVYQCDW